MKFSGGSDLEAVSVAHIPDLARITHIFLQFLRSILMPSSAEDGPWASRSSRSHYADFSCFSFLSLGNMAWETPGLDRVGEPVAWFPGLGNLVRPGEHHGIHIGRLGFLPGGSEATLSRLGGPRGGRDWGIICKVPDSEAAPHCKYRQGVEFLPTARHGRSTDREILPTSRHEGCT